MRASDFIVETAEESQALNAVANAMTKGIIQVLNDRPGLVKQALRIMFNPTARASSKAKELTTMTLRPSQLGAPKTNIPSVDTMLDNIGILVDDKPTANADNNEVNSSLGSYNPDIRRIKLNLPALYIKRIVDGKQEFRNTQEFVSLMRSTLVHEMQHAMDDLKSKGKALPLISVDADEATYLRSKGEISARFQEALMMIANNLNGLKSIDLDPSMKDLPALIKSAFRESEIERMMFDRPQQYNRLLSRAYKFFQAELQNPKKEVPQNVARRALNWILGKATTQLK